MMTKLKGIDVSYHNGTIDWNEVSKTVDFAIIRAGYGKGNTDKKFFENSIGCEKANIPYGYYWFSYACTPEMAEKEADYCCDLINAFSPTYPICFDFEYGSLNYAKKCGYELTSSDIVAICKAFLDRVEKRGYYAMVYANPDFLENYGLKELMNRYALWIAKWSNNPPSYKFGIWQYGTENIKGVGTVDVNISLKDYHSIISKLMTVNKDVKMDVALSLKDEWWKRYISLAKRGLVGIYSDLELEEICMHNRMDYDVLLALMEVIYE